MVRGQTGEPRYGSSSSPGQKSEPSSGLYTPLKLLAASMLAQSPLSRRAGGLWQSRLQLLPALQPCCPGAGAKAEQRQRQIHLSGMPSSDPSQLGLLCKPFSASHPRQESPGGGDLGRDKGELFPEPTQCHPHPSLDGRKGGGHLAEVNERKDGQVPWAPSCAFSPCPSVCPLLCQRK